MDNKTKEKIKEVNEEISGGLSFWADVLNTADADQWAYYLDYSDKDLLSSLYIFNHVAQNIAIKKGVFTEENAESKMEEFKKAVKEIFGFDSVELTNKVLNKQ